jgi:hypothetical protein
MVLFVGVVVGARRVVEPLTHRPCPRCSAIPAPDIGGRVCGR